MIIPFPIAYELFLVRHKPNVFLVFFLLGIIPDIDYRLPVKRRPITFTVFVILKE